MVLDSQGREVCVTRLVDISVCSLREVTLDHAVAEGEGFASVAAWRKAHEDFWSSEEFVRSLGDPPLAIDDDTRVICQRFCVVERLDADIC